MRLLASLFRRAAHRSRIRFRPRLECLEDRTVPSTLIDDVPDGTFATIALSAAGAGSQAGTIDYAGDVDLFAFTSSVTGQTTIKVDGGVIPEQTISVLVTAGQTYAFSVFADGTTTGGYQISITSIADDFPDVTTHTIVLDPNGSGTRTGVINYADDVDVFRFTATASGTMTLTMSTPNSSQLQSSVTVPRVVILANYTPPPANSSGQSTTKEIIQFQVEFGQEYIVRAAGKSGSHGSYTLSFEIATDDFSATAPTSIALAAVATPPAGVTGSLLQRGSTSGSIEVPNDRDLFQFTASATGYAIVELDGVGGTDFHGMLTTSVTPLVAEPDRGFVTPNPDGGFFVFINAAGHATLPTDSNGDTLDPFIIIPVVAGQTYQIGVSGDGVLPDRTSGPTLGKYALKVSTYSADTVGSVTIRRLAFYEHFNTEYLVTVAFLGASEEPIFSMIYTSFAPVFPPGPPPVPTDARLAIATLPSATLSSTGTSASSSSASLAAPTLDVATVGVGASGSPAASASAAGATLPASSLLVALLGVAARDNSATGLPGSNGPGGPLTEGMVRATGPALQFDFAAPGGSEEGTTITGTVYEDMNGDGARQADEPFLAGETVVLERVQDGKTVVVTTSTDARGNYRFANLEPGEYHLSLQHRAGPPESSPTVVRISLPASSPVVHIAKPANTGARRNPEPADTTSSLTLPTMPEPQSRAFEPDSLELVRDAARVGSLLLIGLPLAPLARVDRRKKSRRRRRS